MTAIDVRDLPAPAADGLTALTASISARPVATARLARLAAHAMTEFGHVDLRSFPGAAEFTRLALPPDAAGAEHVAGWMSEPARHGAVDVSLRVLSRVLHLDQPLTDLPRSRDHDPEDRP